MAIVESLLRELEEKTCDLRCRSVPTGGDDHDVEWFVIEHHMAEPTEREIGQGRNITEELLVAFHGLTEDDLIETMPDYDPMAHSS